MARGPRGTKIADLPHGTVYQDAHGLSARVFVQGQQRERRFPATADLREMQRWDAETYLELADRAAAPPTKVASVRGTFTGDAAVYLKKRLGRPGYKSDRSHLAACTAMLGDKPRHKITPRHYEELIGRWRAKGISEKTIRHRVRVTRECWRALDGPRAVSPVDGLKLPALPRPHPQPVSPDMIRAVAASLRKGLTIQQRCGPARTRTTVQRARSAQTYARFLVRALTGQRADQIMKAQPADVDLDARIWWVRPAKGGHQVPLALNDEMIVAWRIFIGADAWGTWDWRSFAKTLRRHGWPADVPPKNLRHTFAIDHLLAGTDLGDLQGLLGHANVQTTRSFYAPVLVSRLKTAVGRRTLGLVPSETVPSAPVVLVHFPTETRADAKSHRRLGGDAKQAKKA